MKNKLFLVALAFVGILITSCSEEDNITDFVAPQRTVTLTTTIDLDIATTRALTEGGTKTFAEGEKVAVIYTNTSSQKAIAEYTLQTADIRNSGKNADLTFTLTDPKDGNSQVTFVYPAYLADKNAADGISMTKLQSAQDGTFATLSSKFDAATAVNQDMTVASSVATLPGSILLTNPLCIGKFTIKESAGNSDITNTITSFTVSDGTNSYSVNRKAADGPVYVAMKPITGNLTVSATDGYDGYEKAVTGKSLDANKIYPISVKMTKTFDAKSTPLTFEAIAAGTVTFSPAEGSSITVQYKKNSGAWTDYTSSIDLDAGDKVAFRGANVTYYYKNNGKLSHFGCSADCYIYGNIMSLVTDYTSDENAFTTNVELINVLNSYTFGKLFLNDTHIKNHASKPLVLPATSLADCCYYMMFQGCTGLTTAPVLPATTLVDYCYEDMFNSCTGLTTAPDLPATTLRTGCYSGMFYYCTSLTKAPNLPATTLAGYCYKGMFSYCTSLTKAPVLPATSLTEECYSYMFRGCTSLTTAPVLPATSLALSCYNNMFNSCSSLSSVTCLATNVDAYYCLSNWLNQTATTGTLYIAPGATWAEPDAYDIPSGWTVASYEAPSCTTATSDDIGKLIGQNGRMYYSTAEATLFGTTAEAIIAYVGEVAGVCTHGLALALTDADWGKYADAVGYTVMYDWNVNHSVTDGTWRVPSVEEWQYIMWGHYDSTLTTAPVGKVMAVFPESPCNFWSKDPVDGTYAYGVHYDNSTLKTSIQSLSKENNQRIRACLAF